MCSRTEWYMIMLNIQKPRLLRKISSIASLYNASAGWLREMTVR